MDDTMTLEELRESLDVGCLPNTDRPRWFAAIDAAIRERDELRDRLDSALGDRISEFRRANGESRRAERAEAELAALRKRLMLHVYTCEANVISGRDHDYISAILVHDDPAFQYPDLDGKRVALVLLDDSEATP